jgi:putative tryptophan/tyrosine transport system substrate-binding protein
LSESWRTVCFWLDVLRDYHGSRRSHNFRRFVTEDGLISFGIDQAALYRLAASYVDRILKGEKPADLPVQAPTKYKTVLNIKTAKALGLEVPPTLLARPDEVIE